MYVAARVDKEKCNGCKLCVLTCPDPNVISIKEKKASVEDARCKGCKLCAEVCPDVVIEVYK